MFYKPKFCCECGEKIERIDWKPWTSRRFCDFCKTNHQVGEKLPIVLVIVCILIGLAGLGSFWQRGEKTSSLNLVAAASPNKNINQASRRNETENDSVQPLAQIRTTNSATETPAKTSNSAAQNLKTGQTQSEQISVKNEVIYFCGAQTKKGTACSHRVKGGGRCWQHAGQAAMLPQEKLLVRQ